MATAPDRRITAVEDRIKEHSLFEALLNRRSRRFGRGFNLNGGPLQYRSELSPDPLSLEEEAALAFAACGITGSTLADVPFQTGHVPDASGGNMLTHVVGRTVPSPDAMHTVAVFVINDDGAWLLRRPQDFPREEIRGLAEIARRGDLVELYLRSRIQIANTRVDVPHGYPYRIPLNKWSANRPGTTYFLPVAEVSGFMIDVLLTAFDREWASYPLDDRNWFRPAGVSAFGKSKGGYLHDNPAAGRVMPVSAIEGIINELAAVEAGAIIQNLGLMAQALGLGGFPHDASHPYAWFEALGFRIEHKPTSKITGMGQLMKLMLTLSRQNLPFPTAVGLERDGTPLLKPWCPPFYRDMEHAVRSYVTYKFLPGTGTFRDGGEAAAWKNGSEVQAGIPEPDPEAIEATVAYCQYIYDRYGRFPSSNGPFRTSVAFQAQRLDRSFYDRFYREGALVGLDIDRDE